MIIYYHCTRDSALLLSFLLTSNDFYIILVYKKKGAVCSSNKSVDLTIVFSEDDCDDEHTQ